ncbi:uncharacterized protein LOC135347818 isoform X2 [Halichondria panicea]|uniref:uncharacterized protein LOC135347818 isoform X2 n=1 Tax=Halichondria panicea TaxID=6063 RepID=UPI00312B9794
MVRLMFAVILVLLTCHGQVEATLTSTSTVAACPDDIVTFTCTLPGNVLAWNIIPPQGQENNNMFRITLTASNTDETQGNPAFRAVLTDFSGPLTATLTSLSEASIVEGTMVLCEGEGSLEGPLTITVADSPSSPLNPRVSATQNQPSSFNITLDWDPPSSTGGVSARYVLTISPTSLSGSPVTVETTSAQITIFYNTPYNVTIRAVNCVGMSQEASIEDLIVCPTPSTATGVTITNTPPVTIGGSMLTFACNGDNEVITSTCGSSGWSPDPVTFDCGIPVTDPPVTCGSPAIPSRGSVDISGRLPPFSLGSQVIYRCDDGLFPPDVRTSTCTDVGDSGEWVENPGSLLCRERPVNCTLPTEPCNGAIVEYERLNETVLEGTVLTYQCDNGLSLTGPNTITCTNTGVWSTEPEAIMCVVSTVAPLFSTSATVAISVVITFIVTLVIGFLTGLLVMYLFFRKKAVYFPATEGQTNTASTAPAGPVYEEVSPKEEIELNTNQAYGPLGL